MQFQGGFAATRLELGYVKGEQMLRKDMHRLKDNSRTQQVKLAADVGPCDQLRLELTEPTDSCGRLIIYKLVAICEHPEPPAVAPADAPAAASAAAPAAAPADAPAAAPADAPAAAPADAPVDAPADAPAAASADGDQPVES